jgi:hypothetical protein
MDRFLRLHLSQSLLKSNLSHCDSLDFKFHWIRR